MNLTELIGERKNRIAFGILSILLITSLSLKIYKNNLPKKIDYYSFLYHKNPGKVMLENYEHKPKWKFYFLIDEKRSSKKSLIADDGTFMYISSNSKNLSIIGSSHAKYLLFLKDPNENKEDFLIKYIKGYRNLKRALKN